MQKRKTVVPIAGVFLLLSLFVFFLFHARIMQGISGLFEILVVPVQRTFKGAFGTLAYSNSSWEQLVEENRTLASGFAKQKELEREMKALRDQFETTSIPTPNLLPANVVSSRGFIPGVSMPEEILIDKGRKDQVKTGMVVIYKDNIVGKTTRVSDHMSQVELLSNKNTSFAARALKTDALGIVKGGGNGAILFTNVVLSDTLEKDDIIVTKGEQEFEGSGFPPDLVIGKIIAIDKKASNLFQAAEVRTLLDLPKLTTVFIMVQK